MEPCKNSPGVAGMVAQRGRSHVSGVQGSCQEGNRNASWACVSQQTTTLTGLPGEALSPSNPELCNRPLSAPRSYSHKRWSGCGAVGGQARGQ